MRERSHMMEAEQFSPFREQIYIRHSSSLVGIYMVWGQCCASYREWQFDSTCIVYSHLCSLAILWYLAFSDPAGTIKDREGILENVHTRALIGYVSSRSIFESIQDFQVSITQPHNATQLWRLLCGNSVGSTCVKEFGVGGWLEAALMMYILQSNAWPQNPGNDSNKKSWEDARGSHSVWRKYYWYWNHLWIKQMTITTGFESWTSPYELSTIIDAAVMAQQDLYQVTTSLKTFHSPGVYS